MTNQYSERFARYSDAQLVDVLLQPDEYLPAAHAAARDEAVSRGGVDALIAAAELERVRAMAAVEVYEQVTKLVFEEASADQLAAITHPDLSRDDIAAIVREVIDKRRLDVIDSTETAGSAFRSLIGGGVAIALGTVYARYAMFGGRAVFLLIVVGLAMMCYGIVSVVAGKKNTVMVWLMTLVSFVVAIYLGGIWAFGGMDEFRQVRFTP